jgi:hypothetical protein
MKAVEHHLIALLNKSPEPCSEVRIPSDGSLVVVVGNNQQGSHGDADLHQVCEYPCHGGPGERGDIMNGNHQGGIRSRDLAAT